MIPSSACLPWPPDQPGQSRQRGGSAKLHHHQGHDPRNRIIQVDYNKPINFASVSVSPGDYVIADGSGIVFVPAPRISEVLDIADRIAKKQNAMVAAVRAGRSVVEVMHDREFEKAV